MELLPVSLSSNNLKGVLLSRTCRADDLQTVRKIDNDLILICNRTKENQRSPRNDGTLILIAILPIASATAPAALVSPDGLVFQILCHPSRS